MLLRHPSRSLLSQIPSASQSRINPIKHLTCSAPLRLILQSSSDDVIRYKSQAPGHQHRKFHHNCSQSYTHIQFHPRIIHPAKLPSTNHYKIINSPIIASFITSFLRSFTSDPKATMAAQAKVQKLIDENSVVVFSKSYCPYCKAAKKLLTELGAKFEALELDQIDDGSDIQAALKTLTNQNTVPNIFIGQKHIGGNSDLQAKKSELPALLQAAGAV